MKIFTFAGVALIMFSISTVHAEDKAAPKAAATKAAAAATDAKEKVEAKKEEEKAPAPAEVAKETPSDTSDFGGYGKPRGLLGPITLGPQVTLLGLPTLFRFGIEGRFLNLIGFGLEYGFVPTVTLSSVALNLNAILGTVKIFPARGAFYLGAAMGSQNFSGTIPTTIAGTTVTMTGTANTFFLTPMLGWKWIKPSGFFMGLDFGWQIALSASSSITSNPAALAVAAAATGEFTSLTNVLNSIGKASLPSISALQFGWLF